MGRNVSWGCVRGTLLAFRAGFRSGHQLPETYFKIPQKIVRNCTSSMELKTAGNKLNWRPTDTCLQRGWSHRSFSTDRDMKVGGDESAIRRLPVKVGAQLKIDVVGTDAQVDVTVGDSLEEIVLEARWKAGHVHGDWSSFTICENLTNIWLKTIVDFPNPQSAVLEGLKAAMPARWCSLVVEAGRRPVRIQSLKEGSLTVKTFGGDITLGDLRGGTASIDSNGGSFNADMVSADSVIRTGGGSLSVNKLVGTTIDVDTGGGDAVIGSLYGNDVVLESGGGAIKAKHIQAQNMACLSTEGGAITVNGIDGIAKFVTRGGPVDLQLHEHAREVEIDTSEGSVTLYFSENLSAQVGPLDNERTIFELLCQLVEYHGARAIEQDSPILVVTHEPGLYSYIGEECWEITHGDESRASRSEEASHASREIPWLCRIRIISSGTVHVKKRSWLELAKATAVPSPVN